MDEADREALTAQFQTFLESLEDEPSSEDVEQNPPDLFTLFAELAALKNEVKLESRQVKAALEQFRELFDTLRQSNAGSEEERVRRLAAEQTNRDAWERALMLEMVELRDHFQAGLSQAQRYQPSWLARRAGVGDFAKGMTEGMDINLRRFDNILNRRGVRPLKTLNQPFNPRFMHAVEVELHPDRETGVVVSEVRAGYAHKGRLLRPAEVIVNKKENS